MFGEDTPFASRAQFMWDNVMEPSADFLAQYSPQQHPGFQAFRALLLTLYSTPDAFEGADDLARFHALSYTTQLFFSAVATAGTLCEEGQALLVTKAAFKSAYKKPSNAPFTILPGFGVAFKYTKKEKPAASYSACDAFTLRFPQHAGIPAALKEMAQHFDAVDHKAEYGDAPTMLGKADFDRLVLGRPALRGEINPLRADIVHATGTGEPLYTDIVQRSMELGLDISASIQRYANPTWNINFMRKKQLRLKTIWCEGRNFVHVPIPFAKAEAIIRSRHTLPPRVRQAIERFGCVQCGRCKKGSNVKFLRVDTITICTGHGESSTIFMTFESLDETAAVFEIIASLD